MLVRLRKFWLTWMPLSLAVLVWTATPVLAGSGLEGATIVIDPGHGGRDPGAVDHGIREKDLTLAIARQLKPILEAQRAKVILTRSTDTALGPTTKADLQERVRIAQQAHANAFISIHGNETADPGYSGVTTYYGTACDYSSGITLPSVDVGRSFALASRVESSLAQRTREVNRGAKSMPFWVLGDRGIPSILIETGFLSNAAEAAKLASPNYQRVVADAIGDGLARYFAADASGQPASPVEAFHGCPGPPPASTRPSTHLAPERWVQTFLATPLLSGPEPHAKQFVMLSPFSYLKVLGQQSDYLHVLNSATNGPGWVEAKKVGPSGPPLTKTPRHTFEPSWVENFRPAQLWSGPDAKATSFGTLPPWHFFEVVAPGLGPRLLVKVDATGSVAYVDRASVGPSGPPPTSKPASQSTESVPPRASAGTTPGWRVTLKPGETLTAVANQYRTTVAALMAANGLQSPDHVQAGQQLTLPRSLQSAASQPAPRTARVIVKAGETLSAIATRSHTTVDKLQSMNGLAVADRIVAGQTLLVPE